MAVSVKLTSRNFIAMIIAGIQGKEIRATPKETSKAPAHLRRLIRSFKISFAPRVLTTKLSDVAGMIKLKSAQDSTARKAKKLTAMKTIPTRKNLLPRIFFPINARARGRMVEISPACFMPFVKNTSPAEPASTTIAIAIAVAVFIDTPGPHDLLFAFRALKDQTSRQ